MSPYAETVIADMTEAEEFLTRTPEAHKLDRLPMADGVVVRGWREVLVLPRSDGKGGRTAMVCTPCVETFVRRGYERTGYHAPTTKAREECGACHVAGIFDETFGVGRTDS